LRELPGGGPLAGLALRFPTAARRGYQWVTEHRSDFGPWIPAPAIRGADRRIRERS
jgi:hypothetical protein